jgi:capsular exopolysaccharide synthesis family protein
VFDKNAEDFPLISQSSKYSQRTEAFRHLRTNLSFLNPKSPPKIIAITSAGPGDGKSTTAINLSITLTEAGFQVLLIDCDLRRPKIATYLGVEGMQKLPGLSDILKKSPAALNFKIAKYNFAESRSFSYILSGPIPPNPTDLLSTDNFEVTLRKMMRKFDYIILDTPPVLPVADTSLIGAVSDGMLIVARAGITRIAQYEGMVKAISSHGTEILGVVINMIPPHYRGETYGYAYGQYYYGDRAYYGQYGRKEKNSLLEPYAPIIKPTGNDEPGINDENEQLIKRLFKQQDEKMRSRRSKIEG